MPGAASRQKRSLRPHGCVLCRIRSTGHGLTPSIAICYRHDDSHAGPNGLPVRRRQSPATAAPQQATTPRTDSLPVVTTAETYLPAAPTSTFVIGKGRKVVAQLIMRRAPYITIVFGQIVPDSELSQIAAARFQIDRIAGSLVEYAPKAARRRTQSVDRMKQV